MRTRSIVALAAASLLSLSACGGGAADNAASGEAAAAGAPIVVRVGASPVPHAKILQFIDKELAPAAGIDLEITEFTDYIQPNVQLNEGGLDANYFQTIPYLDDQVKEYGYEFTPGKGVHLEPLALYSSKHKDVKDLPDGAKIGIIADVTNQARALRLLATVGLVELPAEGDVNIHTAKKLKNFEWVEVEGAQLARTLADVDAAVINGNFAQDAGLSPKDGLVIEPAENNPSSNLLVWKNDITGDAQKGVQKLEELLHTDEVRNFIKENWADGAVIPSF